MKTKEELQAEINTALSAIRAIEDREWRELNSSLVGKCFKYHNSYGSGDRWWLYAKVLRAGTRYDCRCFQFCTDRDGKHEIEPNVRVSPNFIGGKDSSWHPITLTEFNRELGKLRRKIAGYKP